MKNNSYDSDNGSKSKEYIDANTQLMLSLLHTMPFSVAIANSKLEVVMCNERAYKLFGCQTEEEFYSNFRKLSPKYQPDGLQSSVKFAQMMAEANYEEDQVFEWTHCNVDGDIIPFNITLVKSEIIDQYGGNFIIGYLQDMRPILLRDEAERRYTKRMRAILDATPLSCNIWTKKFETILCNKKAYEMFRLSNEAEFINEAFNISPEFQPNGRNSIELANEYMVKAFETGTCKFKWLFVNLEGEEIPTEVTLIKISDIEKEDIVAAFVRDLRDSMAGNEVEDNIQSDSYFLNQISDKALFKTIATLSDELFFSIDLRTSIIQYFGNRDNVLNTDNKKILFPDNIIERKLIYAEDIPLLIKLNENIQNGISEPIDVRLVEKFEQQHYFRIIYEFIYNEQNQPIFAVGKASDIHEQKKLEERATTDLLTTCYNKITTEKEIDHILELSMKEEQHILYIIDIDDFKCINDKLGHHFGDLVLKEVASQLKLNFRSQDIIGRIGGDEFIILAKDISDIEILEQKAKSIVNSFKNTYSSETGDYKISVSIGISKYPSAGNTYHKLYRAADKALYESKKRGKNCYTLYSKIV